MPVIVGRSAARVAAWRADQSKLSIVGLDLPTVSHLPDQSPRRCSRPGCNRLAVATLTYAYADQTAVIGPLIQENNPHSWDLCETHSARITAPKNWELVRVKTVEIEDDEDLLALAQAVREDGRVTTGLVDGFDAGSGDDVIDYGSATFDAADPDNSNHPVFRTRRVADEKTRRRAHLKVVADDADA